MKYLLIAFACTLLIGCGQVSFQTLKTAQLANVDGGNDIDKGDDNNNNNGGNTGGDSDGDNNNSGDNGDGNNNDNGDNNDGDNNNGDNNDGDNNNGDNNDNDDGDSSTNSGFGLVPIDGDDASDFNASTTMENGSQAVRSIGNGQYQMTYERTVRSEDGQTASNHNVLDSSKIVFQNPVPVVREDGTLAYPKGRKCVKNVNGVAHKLVYNDGQRTRDVCSTQIGFSFACYDVNPFFSAVKSEDCQSGDVIFIDRKRSGGGGEG